MSEETPYFIRHTVGKCNFNSLRGPCSCKAGIIETVQKTLDQNTFCNTCSHPFYKHEGLNRASTYNPPDHYTPRRALVESLANIYLDREATLIHIRGGPSTGKTFLAEQLHDYFDAKQYPVIFVDKWDKKLPADANIRRKAVQSGLTDLHRYGSLPRAIYILDDAEYTFAGGASMWYGVIKEAGRGMTGSCFYVFSSYGETGRGAMETDYPKSVTAATVMDAGRISLTRKVNDERWLWFYDSGARLFYDEEEFDDVVGRWCKEEMAEVPEFGLNKDLRRYIFSMTDGYPGAVHSVLDFVGKCHYSCLKWKSVTTITLEIIREQLDNDKELFDFLQYQLIGKSLPPRNNAILDSKVVDILLKVLREGNIKLQNQKDPAMAYCYKNGFLQIEEEENEVLFCVFPSPLHARFVEYAYARINPTPFPTDKYPAPAQLCEAVLHRCCSKMIRKAREGRRPGVSARKRPLEAAVRDEFHRSLYNEVPNVGIQSNWVPCEKDRFDYVLPDPGWGIKVLHEGQGLSGDPTSGGAFDPPLNTDDVTDWLVLDCRDAYPSTAYPNEQHLLRAIFKDEYTRVHILDSKNEEVVPEFTLVGDDDCWTCIYQRRSARIWRR